MSFSKDNFFSRYCGKWILTGEHVLVRGGPALTFPLQDLYMEVQYKAGLPLSFHFEGEFFDVKKNKYFEEAVCKSFSLIEREPEGSFHLFSKIPLGCGLGGSAAFCLSLSDIFFQMGYIKDLAGFAWRMENFFHGKSSGSDIQTIYHKKSLIFKSSKNFEFFEPGWRPHIYLYNTGIMSLTKKCVEKVSNMFDQSLEKSKQIDEQMSLAVKESIEALKKPSQEEGLDLLAGSITRACDCFEQWDLLEPMRPSLEKLKSLGALSVKPTGAGDGGFLIGLWKNPLPKSLLNKNFFPVSF